MATGASYIVQYRRRREERTDYKRRLALLKSRKTRLVVRETNNRMITQVVNYEQDGDRVVVFADSRELAKYGWKYSGSNIPACYLAGFLCAKKALSAGVSEAILDKGLQGHIKGSRIYATLKGAIDGGLAMPADSEVFPAEDRISGAHIADYASKLDKDAYEKKFSGYLKAGADPKDMPKAFEETKKKITESLK